MRLFGDFETLWIRSAKPTEQLKKCLGFANNAHLSIIAYTLESQLKVASRGICFRKPPFTPFFTKKSPFLQVDNFRVIYFIVRLLALGLTKRSNFISVLNFFDKIQGSSKGIEQNLFSSNFSSFSWFFVNEIFHSFWQFETFRNVGIYDIWMLQE